MTVRCFAVDGLLVDAGLSTHATPVRAFAEAEGVGHAVITHHHEDHSGNAIALREAGLEVRAGGRTREWMRAGFSTRFYQRVVWSPAPAGELDPLGDVVETERHRFQVIAAPGHCDDQVVLFEPSEGWLFSGDAFLAARVKFFRGDEDYEATVSSLRRLTELDFDALFCAHRPVPTGGRDALRDKLEHLVRLGEQVRQLHAEGVEEAEITRRTLGPDPWGMWLFSAGDLSKRNLVRAILHGPRPRPDSPPARSP
jgi:glyoxylase-like metal-dependent hydrolase (beta-lactamase superfamily II)